MPLSSHNSTAVRFPEIPFDKIRYGLNVADYIATDGMLRATGHLRVTRCRYLPDGTCEDAPPVPGDPPVVKTIPIQDWFALAGETNEDGTPKYPAMGQALLALHTAVAEFNAIHQLV